jgi:molecular chaperone GrpE
MTKDQPGKRRIEIEDKRMRDEQLVGAEPSLGLQSELQEANSQCFATGSDAVEPPTAPDTGKMPAPPETPDYQQQAAEYLDLAQRKEAELRNYRKRAQQDLEDARRFAVEGLLADLFPALDGLAQCARTYKDKVDGEDPLLDGVRRTVRALEGALLKHGVTKIGVADVPFDPSLHQALSVEASDDITEEVVAEVYVEGYRMGDVVLKPAMVRVVKPA